MLDNEFKKSAIAKLKSMDSNELKKAFKEIGSEPETNEEWLRQAATEQLAELLLRFYYQDFCMNTKRSVIEWLKQPHQKE